ncbi:WNT1-inducible-signaling pathway protein 1-like, partial [Cricetulus griseus]|uniref:WNT1-inducible-signaling pathway protein 1-like n=1 Tax=Cricetulus griseus TaxID=10029 RepID=UPI0015C3F081
MRWLLPWTLAAVAVVVAGNVLATVSPSWGPDPLPPGAEAKGLGVKTRWVGMHVYHLCFAEVVGVGCVLDGVRYNNGESFQPNCRYNCTCIDGTVGCTPLCLSPRPPRLWCRQPRHVRVPGQCCEQWVCDDDARRPRQTALLDTRAFGKCGRDKWSLGIPRSPWSPDFLLINQGHYPSHNSPVKWSWGCAVWNPNFPS